LKALLDACVWGRARIELEAAGHEVVWAGDWPEDIVFRAAAETVATFALIIAVLSVLGMAVAFLPCLGWLNWLNHPFALVGCVFASQSTNSSHPINRCLHRHERRAR
jgi:hypothetical protein